LTNSVTESRFVVSRKTFPVRRRYIDADAAQVAIGRKIAALKGEIIPGPEKVTYDRESILGRTYKQAPFSDKRPAQKAGLKPKYQGMATPMSPRQLVRCVGVRVDEPITDNFIPKSARVKAVRVQRGVTQRDQLFRAFRLEQRSQSSLDVDGTITDQDLRELDRARRADQARSATHNMQEHKLPSLRQGEM
jgi:hypothetical protein